MTEANLDVAFRPVDERTWPDLVRLFEAPGGPKHCWCLVWRLRGAQANLPVAGRKAELERRMHEAPIGILAYIDGEPAGWCSVAPKPTYRPMGGPGPEVASPIASEAEPKAEQTAEPTAEAKAEARADAEAGAVAASAVWTIACFYVPRRVRKSGLATRLLDAAVEYAAANGARIVEGYPVAIDSPSFRFMGFVEMFRAAGFEYVAPVGRRRHLVRRALRA